MLHDFEGRDFYGEELRLLVFGYIRPEATFVDLDALIARIREDGRITEHLLATVPELKALYHDDFLTA